jgi:hypothetical protein
MLLTSNMYDLLDYVTPAINKTSCVTKHINPILFAYCFFFAKNSSAFCEAVQTSA